MQARKYSTLVQEKQKTDASGQRLKEMKQLTKDPNAANKAREAERKANEEAGLKSINLSLPGAPAGTLNKKKPVFKSTLQPHNAAVISQATGASTAAKAINMSDAANDDWLDEYNADPTQMIANGWSDDQYDPRFPDGGEDGVFDPKESYEAYMKRTEPELKVWESRMRASMPAR